jgi:hypothetical protein
VADIQTGEAARRLGTTTQTVGKLIDKKLLVAVRADPRKKRSNWLVDEESVQAYIREHGRIDARPRGAGSRLAAVEADVAELRRALETAGVAPAPDTATARERDELRAQVSNLREALARSREVAELQRGADAERSRVIEYLNAALVASERADALRRRVAEALDDALAAALGPGHPGNLK